MHLSCPLQVSSPACVSECVSPPFSLSLAEAAALERELLEEYCFGRQQLVELCGYASAVAVTKAFPLPSLSRKQRTVLVVCGPEQNGAVGLACARHLRVFEYQPSVFSPARPADPLHRDLTTQCEKMDIPFLSFLPAEVRLIDDAYGLVVDAVLGPGVRPAEAGGPCARALTTMKRLSIPLVSLDVPSGTGPGVSYQPVSPSSPSSAGTPRLAAMWRTRCSPTCWCRSQRPRAALAASPGATTSWPAGSSQTRCAASLPCVCRNTRAPTAWPRCDRGVL
ncbi:yjeF N-terminal domain-containing protein 3 isoform X2 [Nannospalax galili]|uniref:yjeF N-terminal domain-containing protein 3 isoform X2 n=1 Tax=Nannospalax galili TaxID=1026970 RepID=UPI00111C660A|nr:yjeF N-terminal domain-containing protein 3 isoform X2 [Nannospalax galili]